MVLSRINRVKKTCIIISLLVCLMLVASVPMLTKASHLTLTKEKDFSISSSGWYFPAWHYRTPIPITYSLGAGEGYQVRVNVTWRATMLPDFEDLIFTDGDGTTLLSYWTQTYVEMSYALVWVKVAGSLDSDQIIYVYYGNADASTLSSGLDTFLFFDDFNDNTLNASKWHIFTGAGTPLEFSGVLSLTVASGWSSYGSYERFGDNVALGMLTKVSGETTYWQIGLDERTYDGTASGGVDWCGVVNNAGTKYYSSSDGTAENVARTTLYTSYVNVEIRRVGTKVEFLESGISKASITSHLPVDNAGVAILNLNAHTEYWDYVYVRNCIASEPVVGTFGDEENNIGARPWALGEWVQNEEPIISETDGTNEPQVIYDTEPQILTNLTYVYKMWYRVGWATVSIYYAESADGLTWAKYASNPVLDETGDHYCPFVLRLDNGTYVLYAGYGPWLGDTVYISQDGITWEVQNGGNPVIEPGAGSEWDSYAIGNVAVWVNSSGIWNMIYEAYAVGSVWKLGLATSEDGIDWDKYPYPIVSRSGACGGPSVIHLYDTYFMFFHSAESGGLPTEIYITSSKDLIHWTEPEHILARLYDWEGVGLSVGQVADPDIILIGDEWVMYYAGVSAQSLGNQDIGYARFVGMEETYQELFAPYLVLFGLIMIPASTMYLVKGGKQELSAEKFMIFFMVFLIGWAFILGTVII